MGSVRTIVDRERNDKSLRRNCIVKGVPAHLKVLIAMCKCEEEATYLLLRGQINN